MNQKQTPGTPAAELECIEKSGPWPFITRHVYRAADESKRVWSSRHHRKGLLRRTGTEAEQVVVKYAACLFMPLQLNWWIGTIFAMGSRLFVLASALTLMPSLAQLWALNSTQVNTIFFLGSIPVTIAAYLQLYQAANAAGVGQAAEASLRRPSLFGWRPQDIGWLSSALQFVGTVLFNFNTFDAMIPSLNWFQQDLLIWAPNMTGSVLFLVSGYLGSIETCHTHWAWKPRSISWWGVFMNLPGCVGFMASAVLATGLPGLESTEIQNLSVSCTLAGAIGFLIGSLLMRPEIVQQPDL